MADDDPYADYVPTTIDKDFTVATIAVVAVVLALLVPSTICVRRRKKRRTAPAAREDDGDNGITDAYVAMEEDPGTVEVRYDPLDYVEREIFPEEAADDEKIAFPVEDEDGVVCEDAVARPGWFSRPSRLVDSSRNVQEQQAAELADVLMGEAGEAEDDDAAAADFLDEPEDAAADNDDGAVDLVKVTHCCAKSQRTARLLFSWDAEASRIVRVALPATIGSAAATLTSAATSALVSYHLGADNYVAYCLAHVITGLVNALVGGIGAAVSILVAQAIGAERRYLAGQYEQAAIILEYACLIPLYGVVWWYFADIVRWMGLGEEIGELGLQYLPWLLLSYPIFDCGSVVSEIMWAEDHGGTMTIIDNVYYVTYIALLLGLIFGFDGVADRQPNLTQLGILDVSASALYFVMILGPVEFKGWLNPYKKGLLRSCSVKNWRLVKSIVTMSLPLTIGGIVSTCEWELLTIFATHMGPPEVAAWMILGSIWEIFEYLPGGFTTAVELRVSKHLGDGNPGMAKVAAYKSMLFSVATTGVITALFCGLRHSIVAAYTNVQVIHDILSDLILLVGIANIIMVVGVMAYTILCAQNRTNLATGTYAFLSFAATLPLSMYFVFVRGYDLQSIVFSLIVGYSLSSLALMVFLLTTNWTMCSEAVVDKADKAQEEQARLSKLKEEKKTQKQNKAEAQEQIYRRLEMGFV